MRVVILLLFSISAIYPQLIPSSGHLQFPQTPAGSKDSLPLTISNEYEADVLINDIRHLSARFSLSDTLFTIPAGGEYSLWIYYHPPENVIDQDLVIFESDQAALVVSAEGSGKYNDIYQDSTFNKYDNALKNSLFNMVKNHTSLGYNTARDKMFMEIDNKKVNGQGAPVNTVECVYTGRIAAGYIDRQDVQNNYGFNTEHTWPQSYFGSSEPMLSDLYHLFPTDAAANSVRGNLHFGRVVTGIDWQVGGSKRGKDSLNETVFEPRDLHKGNVARSLLYFTVRYTNLGSFLDQKQEDIFRIWNHFDPADTIERKRNSDIAAYQQKRNPFIDHPEFIDRIYSFRTNQERPKYALMELLSEELIFDSTAAGDTSTVFFYLLNKGNDELTINSITAYDPFYVTSYPSQVDPFSYSAVDVSFIPAASGQFNGEIVVSASSGTDTVAVSGIGTGSISFADNEKKSDFKFYLNQNYPNPFNPLTSIVYSIPENFTPVLLKIYDVLGNLVSMPVEEVKERGTYRVEFDGSSLSSGIYYYTLTAGKFRSVKKMILVK